MDPDWGPPCLNAGTLILVIYDLPGLSSIHEGTMFYHKKDCYVNLSFALRLLWIAADVPLEWKKSFALSCYSDKERPHAHRWTCSH